MKKIILIALALVTIQVSAQKGKQDYRKADRMDRIERYKDFTPEEIAQLQTKKLTLALDLTQSQQNKVEKIHLENAIARQAKMEERQDKTKQEGEKPNKEERLALMNERLDKQIAMKSEMKKILNDEQFEKWEKIQARKKGMRQKKARAKRMKRT